MVPRIMLLCICILLILPAQARADAAVVQEYCEQLVEGQDSPVIIHFSIVNYSLPTAVCDLHFLPEPQPPDPGCEMHGLQAAPGWSGFLNPFGGADFFANTPNDCVAPGTGKTGFHFVVDDPSYCCYIVQFTDATGAVILEQEECFNCTVVSNEELDWGTLKSRFN